MKEFKLLTIWGMFFTFISVIISLFFTKDKTYVPFAESTDANPFSIRKLWKWYIFIFELALCLEMVIAPYFWLFLWSVLNNGKEGSMEEVNLVLCHTISISILLIEFSCVNSVPVILRHYSAISIIIVLYIIVNLVETKVSGKPIYPGITWDSVTGCLIPLGVFLVSFILFWIMSCVSKCKMKKIKNNYLYKDVTTSIIEFDTDSST